MTNLDEGLAAWRSKLDELIVACKGQMIPLVDAEDRFMRVVLDMSAAHHDVVSKFRAEIDNEASSVLFMLSDRLIAKGLKAKDPQAICAAIAALLLEGGTIDPRESLIRLAAANHAAERSGSSGSAALPRSVLVAFEPLPPFFTEFGESAPWQRNLRSMGLEVVNTKDGLEYRPIKPPWDR